MLPTHHSCHETSSWHYNINVMRGAMGVDGSIFFPNTIDKHLTFLTGKGNIISLLSWQASMWATLYR